MPAHTLSPYPPCYPHISQVEWLTFLMLCVVPLGIPYYQFTTSRAKYGVEK